MNQVLTPQDWMKISAFLDGQLSDAEREEVERFCNNYPTWQAGLSALEHTRTLLRSAPKRGAPRNFTISEKIANSIRKPARGILTLRWVNVFSSAIAAILLVFGFVLQSSPTLMSAAPAPEAAVLMEQSAPAELQPTLPPIIIWGMPGTIPQGYGKGNDPIYGMGRGGGGGGGDGGFVPAPVGGGIDTAPAPAALAPEMTEGGVVPPSADEVPAPAADQSAPLEIPGTGPILGLNTEPSLGSAIEPAQVIREGSEGSVLIQQPLIIAGLILAIAAIVTGILAWRKPTS